MTELKPCPFCGRNHGLLIASIHHRLDDITYEQWSVFCDASGDKVGCGASCGYHRTKAEAIEAWNRRATIEPERGYVEQIKWERDTAIKQLEELGYGLGEKPREPERKKGEWECISDGYFEFVKCDKCGHTQDDQSNYCPHCGSYNGGKQNENR